MIIPHPADNDAFFVVSLDLAGAADRALWLGEQLVGVYRGVAFDLVPLHAGVAGWRVIRAWADVMRLAWIAAAVIALGTIEAAAQSAFSPGGPTVSLAVTGTTGRVQVQSSAGNNVRVYNAGTVAVFLACGDSGITATTAAGLPIAPGTVEIIGCSQQYVAGISAGTAATVYLTPGFGL